MKKTLLITIILMATVPALRSQDTAIIDTVYASLPPDKYYSGNWPFSSSVINGYCPGYYYANGLYYAKLFHVDKGMTVYGIAASLVTPYWHRSSPDIDNFEYMYIDSTIDNRWESLRMYQYSDGNMTQVGEDLPVHAVDTPINYYLNLQLSRRLLGGLTAPVPAFPVYERYYREPHEINGAFYVGGTVSWHEQICGPTDMIEFTVPVLAEGYDSVAFLLRRSDNYTSLYWEFGDSPYYFLIWPILTPAPDTTDTSIDSTLTGIGKVDMVGRYVSVSPNPAGDRATVVSSFGLTAIEAYDPQGRQLYTAPATGLKAELDVSAWPRGTVLLHIHTPAGTTVKKLLLR